MLLENKTAIVYGAAGAVGSAVARAYAREGADVHLAGRTVASLEAVADRIRRAGGTAHVARVDVTDPAAVDEHVAGVVTAGRRGRHLLQRQRRTTTSKARRSSRCGSTTSSLPSRKRSPRITTSLLRRGGT